MQHFIGFDVGGTHIKHGVIDEEGNELTSDEYDTPEDEQTFRKKWQEVVEAYQKEHEIVGIGVSFPGHINSHTGEAAKAGALEYMDGVNLLELFAELTDLPAVVENDANCAALGELWRGAGKSIKTLCALPSAPVLAVGLFSTANFTGARITAPVSLASSRWAIMVNACMKWPPPAG